MVTVELICMIAGAVIAPIVTLFKNLSFVAKHPKIVAFVLSIVVAAVSGLSFGDLDWEAIAACVVVPFSVAVMTYEVAVKPITGGKPPFSGDV